MRAIPLRYDGKDFPSRRALAKHLAGITGRSWQTCNRRLGQFDNDIERVIGFAGKVAVRPAKFSHAGQEFSSREELARHVAAVVGRSWFTCREWLRRFDDDVESVIAHAAKAPTHAWVPITIVGRTFPSQVGFARYLQKNYGVTVDAVSGWLQAKHLSPEHCLERARAYRKKHRKPYQHGGEMVLFGWHFRSPAALCTYYRISYERFRREWRERAPGTPVHAIPACMIALAQLWEMGRLDERNRQPPPIEARLPPACLPTNAVLDEAALATYERAVLDCLQPAAARTPRREGLAWLAHMGRPAVRQGS
jgi:hypothetical protein